MNELAPKDIYSLLINEWKVKENLAIALISIYGGHIWNIYLILQNLITKNDKKLYFDSNLYENIQNCFDSELINENEMITTLRLLAETGFVPLQRRNDPIAQIISDNKVGGIIIRTANHCDFDNEVWKGSQFGLIPTNQAIRLIIALVIRKRGYE